MDKHIKLQQDYANKPWDLMRMYTNSHSFSIMSGNAYHIYPFPTNDIRFLTVVGANTKKAKMLHNDIYSSTTLYPWFNEPHKYCEIVPGGYSVEIGRGYEVGFNNYDRTSYSV